MNITPEQVLRKQHIGHINGAPVFEVETRGGYHIIVTVRNGRMEPLGVGPHRAVARHIARKREPGMQLSELQKSEDDVNPKGPVVRSYEQITDALRKAGGVK